jgi:hypothetical protein
MHMGVGYVGGWHGMQRSLGLGVGARFVGEACVELLQCPAGTSTQQRIYILSKKEW